MAFCPICKNEYREGILICPDCNCELTEELTETEPPVLTIRSEKVKDRFVDYLSYSGINTRVSRDENDERFELYCDKADTDRVKRAFAVFVAVETGNAAASRNNSSLEQATMIADVDDVNDISIPEDWEDALETEEEIDEEIRDLLEEDAVSEITAPAFMHKRQAPTQYVSAAEKSRDTKETGFTLIVIGIVLSGFNYLRIYFIDGIHDTGIALTVCVSMIFIVIFAKLLGSMVPLLVKKVGLDPALIANPAISSVSDAVALSIYFAMAMAFLPI
jgi:hypothetical protein